MKRARAVASGWLVVVLAAPLSARAQDSPKTVAPVPAIGSVADFEWLSGRWVGEVNGSQTEQICSRAYLWLMMCMFRVTDGRNTRGLEFITLRQQQGTVEERVRFFSPELGEKEDAKPLILNLTHHSQTESVFENPSGSHPKRVTLVRDGPDAMTSKIELIDESGKASVIEAHWKRSQ